MEDFNKISRTVIAGIYKFEFIPVNDVLSTPAFGANEIELTDIVLANGKEWNQGEADFNSLNLSINPKYSANGVKFTCELKGFLPDLNQASNFNLVSSAHVKYLIIAHTHQQEQILLGTVSDPLKMGFSLQSEQLGGRKGYPFTFSGEQPAFPSFIARVVGVTFSINSNGILVQNGTNTETFSVNADGMLVVSGPNENDYSINANGHLVQA